YCYPSYSTGNCTAFGGPYNINAIRIGTQTLSGITCTNNGVDTSNLTSSFPIYIGKSTYYRIGCAAVEKYGIYIDFNDDLDFDDAGE
ncbi:hypothetical protein, partial [Streptococcus pneumoniae]|uniref:hypothetical protein n=1 Tax=Streptococcus pneumoniae TaxID=1313 RepID=UPI001E31B1A2